MIIFVLNIYIQHIIITVDVGTREIFRSSSSYTQVYKYLKKRVSQEIELLSNHKKIVHNIKLNYLALHDNGQKFFCMNHLPKSML